MVHYSNSEVERIKRYVIKKYGEKNRKYRYDVVEWIDLIHTHLNSEELTIAWLTKKAGFGKKTSERFHADVGVTAKFYITKLRMEMAKKLIDKGVVNTMILAVYVGYSNRSTFSKAFFRYYGIYPSIYHNKNGGDNSRIYSHMFVVYDTIL
ncbi:AraC family transcriptional regulator [Balneolales bacterium ANBcel1]|nr:AraC family transcriptional regulator [Balneolales bacterium ANBcel1]